MFHGKYAHTYVILTVETEFLVCRTDVGSRRKTLTRQDHTLVSQGTFIGQCFFPLRIFYPSKFFWDVEFLSFLTFLSKFRKRHTNL